MNRKLGFGMFIALLCIIGMVIYRWHDFKTIKESLSSDSHMKGTQERIDRATSTVTEIGEPHKDPEETSAVETPEQLERKTSENIEHLETIHTPAEEGEEHSPLLADPAAVAWERLKFISQNPQQWGELSSDATALMAKLSPTRDPMTEGDTEEVIDLLAELGNLQDPRSAEIFVNYIRESGLWGKPMEEALIAIGPPSVPLLIPLLDANARPKGKLIASKLLGIIGSEHRHELDGAVEYIILPKLEKLATSDSKPLVRQYASEAIARLK